MITDTRIITKKPNNLLSPIIPRKKRAKSSKRPVSETVPITIKIPIKKPMVSQSRFLTITAVF